MAAKMDAQRLRRLREEVCRANLELVENGLVIATFGNASGCDRELGVVAIKPSGVSYERMKPADMVLLDLNGRVFEGELNPSSDTKTHLVLYRHFAGIGGVAHTHSRFATAWAQARRPLPCLGTTHADYFHGEVPCTEPMSEEQIRRDYEEETAVQILETFRRYDYSHVPAVLVAGHGPFTWGKDAAEAVYHGTILEAVAEMGWVSVSLNPALTGIGQALLDKHFLRKHGKDAYYGQRRREAEDPGGP